MKGYKAFKQGFKAYGGFQYEVGKSYHCDGEIKVCANGFHFCANLIDVFGYYPFDREQTVLVEAEARGTIVQEGTKFAASDITIVRQIDWSEVDAEIRDGRYNSGDYNSGDFNSGRYNSGRYNSGRSNSGHFNSGDYNSGRSNSGHFNSGDFNSGHFNSGDYNSGFFNSDAPTVRLFNCDSGMSFKEVFDLGIDWNNLDASRKIIEKLPNYDAQVFFEATGHDWREKEIAE